MQTIRRSLALLAAVLCVASLPALPAAARPAGFGEGTPVEAPPPMVAVQRAGDGETAEIPDWMARESRWRLAERLRSRSAAGGTARFDGPARQGGVAGLGGLADQGGVAGLGGVADQGGVAGLGGVADQGGVAGLGGVAGQGGVAASGGAAGQGGVAGLGGVAGQGGAAGLGGKASRPSAGLEGPIPDEAMLGPAELGGVTPLEVDSDSWPRLRPPQPCEGDYPEAVADRSITAVIEVNRAPNAVMEYLAVHHPGEARRYLRELRDVLKVCKGAAWRIEATDIAGPDSLLLRYSDTFEHVDHWITHHTYLVIARSGRAVVLVADAGWETDSGDPALARKLIIPALQRAAALR